MPTVRVPQADGEIRISVAGNDPTVWTVAEGKVEVSDEDLATFLSSIDGAELDEPPSDEPAGPSEPTAEDPATRTGRTGRTR